MLKHQQPVDLKLFGAHVHACPICGGMRFETLARHDRNLLGVVSVGCRSCGLIQTNPRPSAAGLDLFYRDHYRMFYQGTATPDAKYIANLNKDVRLGGTAAYLSGALRLPVDATILDYGCGEGSLFRALRKAGFTGRFHGVELNASFGEFAEHHGGAKVSNVIESSEPVDLVIVNHVLEHLPDPIGTLAELSKVLKPEGRLYIDVPDAEEYVGIQDLHIAHIFHFTVHTLQRLVEQTGYVVTQIEKHAPPFHPRSIRLIAQPGNSTKPRASSTAVQEKAAWARVRRVGRLRNTLRLRLRSIPMARSAYLLGKRVIGSRSQVAK